jgi:SPP1 family predicted phage head-tail adaptor
VEPGDLRHVVTIEERVETQNDTGEVEWTWRPWQENVRASIEPVTGSERWILPQVNADITARIRIRFRPGITEKMRVVHVTEVSSSPQVIDYYDIESVVHVRERRREIHLMCRKRSAEGFRDAR